MAAFAGYPAPYVYESPGGRRIQQLIWGDYVAIGDGRDGDWVEVQRARNSFGWIKEQDLQPDRLLEVNFVDVGQGDGCFVVTPDDRRLVVDAGKADNLFWFLRWRFNIGNNPDRVIHIDDVVITHPDADHYLGFNALFESPNFTFGTVHHNGIIQRSRSPILGERETIDGVSYLTEVIRSKTALANLVNDTDAVGRAWYPSLMRTALENGRVDDFRMASSFDGHLPGYEPGTPLTAEVLAPVPERHNRRTLLRRLGSDGETKNGHSVVLRLRLGDVKILLSGDLNHRAQEYLLHHYTGRDPSDDDEREEVVILARDHFEADVAKSCHHGSADFSEEFLRAVNPVATVVSSGDDEPYAHPRPDALGALGRWSRGRRPLLFSTELARSTREFVERPEVLRLRAGSELDAARASTDRAGSGGWAAAAYERAVAVYGMINVRTDGNRVVVAQKLERPAPSGTEWDYHCLEPGPDGMRYVPGR